MEKCSFCNKNKDKVKLLIVGPHAGICNECAGMVLGIMMEKFAEGFDINLIKEKKNN